MSVSQRIALCRMIEKMNAQKSFSSKLGLENNSRYQQKQLSQK